MHIPGLRSGACSVLSNRCSESRNTPLLHLGLFGVALVVFFRERERERRRERECKRRREIMRVKETDGEAEREK